MRRGAKHGGGLHGLRTIYTGTGRYQTSRQMDLGYAGEETARRTIRFAS